MGIDKLSRMQIQQQVPTLPFILEQKQFFQICTVPIPPQQNTEDGPRDTPPDSSGPKQYYILFGGCQQ